MKVLLIAKDAQIRDALVTQFNQRNRKFDCVGGDWLSTQNNALVIPQGIDLVVNAINLEELLGPTGYTSFEYVENLARACDSAKIKLIQLSSSHVFDGMGGGRHKEIDEASPNSKLGTSVLKVENIITQACSDYIILRTGLLFSAIGDNLLTSLLGDFREQKSLTLSTTDEGCPTHVGDLARVVSGIIDQLSYGGGAWGIYHYHSSDPVSRFKFAEVLLAAASQCDETFSKEFELKAIEQTDTQWALPLLNCEKILNTFGIKQLPWRLLMIPAVKQVVNSLK